MRTSGGDPACAIAAGWRECRLRSAFAEGELRRHGVRVPTAVISNGVPERFHRVPAPPLVENGKFLVLTVGRIVIEKRQELIVEAIRRSRLRG